MVADPCLYWAAEGEQVYLGVYVDDIIIAAQSNEKLAEVKNRLAKRFDIKDMGKLHHFFGMKVKQDESTGSVDRAAWVYWKAVEKVWNGSS